MSRLIDDLLFLSKADAHSFTVRPGQIEPDTLLLNAYEAFGVMASEKNIRLSIQLPETPAPSCYGDGERLSQVIFILIHNALSYTPAGGQVALSLFVTKKPRSFCVLGVSDNGPGIPDSEKENIFRRFYRLDSSRSAKNHFGLGLCIASEIMSAMNGSIRVEDTPGGGSAFLVSVPLFNGETD